VTTAERIERSSRHSTDGRPRHGYSEPVGDGIRRDHRVDCAASRNRTAGRRCACPLSWWTPSVAGSRRLRFRFLGTVAEAKQLKRQQEADAHAARINPPKINSVPVGSEITLDAFTRWISRHRQRWSPKTERARADAYRLRIHPEFGKVAIGEITTRSIEDWIERLLSEGDGHRSVEIAFQTFRAMLASCVKKGELVRNPAAAVEIPPPPSVAKRKDDLDADEYARVLNACESLADRVLVRIAAELGLRRGELCGLRWEDLDAADSDPNHYLHVVRAIVPGGTGFGPIVKAPKSGKPRVLVIGDSLRQDVAEYRKQRRAEGVYAPTAYVWPGGRRPDPENPRPLDGMTLTNRVAQLFRAAGLVDVESGKPLYRLHDLRRSCASLARSLGVSEDGIQAALGHSSKAVTRGHYIRSASPELPVLAAALGSIADAVPHTRSVTELDRDWIGSEEEPPARRHETPA